MHALAEDPTDIALMKAMPFLPVPRSGASPAIAELTERRTAHGYLAGVDGVFLYAARPWFTARIPVSAPLPLGAAYGHAGPPQIQLHCGLIPGNLIDAAAEFFRDRLPNEAGGFIVWNELTQQFSFQVAETLSASASRLVYRPLHVGSGDHIVADIHSHGAALPFWSFTDDKDDACHTRISIVVGLLNESDDSAGEFIARFCASGVFAPLPKCPATEVSTLTYRPTKPKASE